jgi:orotidine-5'-phosphate decarboxylase
MTSTISWADAVFDGTKKFGALTIGIDPAFDDMPLFLQKDRANFLENFSKILIDCAVGRCGFIKPQSAFFEAEGTNGIIALSKVIAYAKSNNIKIIMDAKRGDIGSTAAAYAKAYLTPHSNSDLESDCLTINPFLGVDSMEPFLDTCVKYNKGVFVLCKTSNPGSGWLQDKIIDGQTVSERVCEALRPWVERTTSNNGLSNIGIVLGLTYPEIGKSIRKLIPSAIFLTPGYGVQGGKIDDVKSMLNDQGYGVLVPTSRSVSAVKDLNISESDYRDLVTERIEKLNKELRV